jgi:alpha-glucosidase
VATGDWWKQGVVYQIYPRSFADSGGDGIGDLPGITSRLDYLNDGTPASLGVDAIWLSPFYPSPMADFGYDISDYCDVHPDFGTLADFDRLVAEAHAHGIRVIIDLVPNHTSDQHPWFQESRSSRDNPKRHWYVWGDSKPDGSPPNNWSSAFPRVGPAWTFDPATEQWYLHSFLPQQPDLNWWNPELRRAMDGVMRFWLDRGVDGFRIDVVHRLSKDPELRDNPLVELDEKDEVDGQTLARILARKRARRYDENWPEVHEILRGFRRTLDHYEDRMAVGEVYLLNPATVAQYYGEAGDELHLAFNFSFLWASWKAEAFRAEADQWESLLPAGAWPDYTLSNHDVSRPASRYDEGGNGQARARVAAMMLLTLRGTPFLYYGEELGMTDGQIPPDRVVDVDGRDPERTPMQWDSSPGAGFTSGEPWLPVAASAARGVSAADERDDPRSLLSLYRRLLWYRKGAPALRHGDYRSLDAPDGIWAYLREAGDERLLVVLNFESRPRAFTPADGLAVEGKLELTTDPDRQAGTVSLRPLELGPDEGVLVRLP